MLLVRCHGAHVGLAGLVTSVAHCHLHVKSQVAGIARSPNSLQPIGSELARSGLRLLLIAGDGNVGFVDVGDYEG